MLDNLLSKKEDVKASATELFTYLSPRISYDINLSQYQIEREMIIHLQLKDIFSDVDSFLRPNAKELFADLDSFLVFDLIAYDAHDYQTVLGQTQLSMIQMIQKQMLDL